ncbi:hypothetical protein CTI12_AA127870 [Artemisia annua]|uniref:RING-type domain-containing protein n=1 Tax=Artemisia annua TaxID=35608 RepID=A0A2U1P590_ARTAN|nr:hypothetical protein CTI12_AA127870 [Artemisia annua]
MIFGVSNDTVLFCACILVLLFRIKQDVVEILVRLVSYVFYPDHFRDVTWDLPIIRFGDLQDRRGQRSFDELCFICLKEYEKDDVVSQLSRCGHVYHTKCVGNLLRDCNVRLNFATIVI